MSMPYYLRTVDRRGYIPPAPPVPAQTESKDVCKIVIAAGKINEGYCIVGTSLLHGPEGLKQLPGTQIYVDRMSANLFSQPSIKAFVAVPKKIGSSQVKVKGVTVYALHPLRKSDYDRYKKKELSNKDVELKYTEPAIKGRGTYGEVEFFPTENIARKRALSKNDDGSISNDMLMELGIYTMMKPYSCMPKLYGTSIGDSINLEFELGVGTLKDAILKDMSIENKVMIMFRLAKCMRVSASQGFIHCDLKPDNCIISRDGQVQIIDWGLAVIDQSLNQQAEKSIYKQTLAYRSPEILVANLLRKNHTGVYDYKIDIFSLGLMFAELFSITAVVFGNNENQQMYGLLRILTDMDRKKLNTDSKIIKAGQDMIVGPSVADKIKHQALTAVQFIPEDTRTPMPEIVADLISHMLEFNPIHRWSYDQIILHPAFQYIHREAIPKLPIFLNNMPIMRDIEVSWAGLPSRRGIFGKITALMGRTNSYNTLCLAFQLTDLVAMRKGMLEMQPLETTMLVYAYACFLIASGIHDVNELLAIDISQMTKVPSQEISEAEKEVVSLLRANIIISSLYSYLSHYRGIQPLSPENTQKWLEIYSRPDIYAKPFSQSWKDL